MPGTPELLIIAVVIILLFGAKRLPEMARSLGRSARILKAETKGLHDDEPVAKALSTDAAPPVARFDPMTGEPLARFDPVTGRPLDAQPGATDRP
ncbi:MAG: twin-arginine translocation protein TatA/E family subunit [Frankiales bacterium]|nr:twin-arginine translocation protein TatA/E family subunit [Frankiales bacterium]